MKPLAIDLYAGLGGWTEGLIAEGFDVIGFDNERHVYGESRYPAQLVIQDVLTLHGSQFRDAALIVASPPCQEYSYMAMPWKRAKAKAAAIRADATGAELERLNRLFNACFRIQREAIAAAGRHIPLIVENVRGAQPWVGRARWNFGSFYLWGDVPALMPMTHNRLKGGQTNWRDHGKSDYRGDQLQDHFKSSGMNWSDRTKTGQDFTRVAGAQAIKNSGGSWFNIAHNTTSGKGQNPDGRKVPDRIIHVRDGADHTPHLTNPAEHEGVKQRGSGRAWWDEALDERRREATAIKIGGGSWFGVYRSGQGPRNHGSNSAKRKAASALIAKIPLPLSRHIAATFRSRATS